MVSMLLVAPLLLVPVVMVATVTAPAPPLRQPVLFVDPGTVLAGRSPELKLNVHPPTAGPRILMPTEPWESYVLGMQGSVVQTKPGDANYSAAAAVRLYYDCTSLAHGVPTNTSRERYGNVGWAPACVAVSADGITWTKPKLDLIRWNGQPSGWHGGNPAHGQLSNVVANCGGASVFLDRAPGVVDSQRWKMFCTSQFSGNAVEFSNSVWTSPDGWHWAPMFSKDHECIHHQDDSQDTGFYDEALGQYVIYVRRDKCCSLGPRSGCDAPCHAPGQPLTPYPYVLRLLGRCVTDDLGNWEKNALDGCPVVLGPDDKDPDFVDVYTSSTTRYAGVTWFFPTFYHHFGATNNPRGLYANHTSPVGRGQVPYGFPNDGLLNIRMLYALNNSHNLSYIGAENGRKPFVGFGLNKCGPHATSPSVMGGWCDYKNGVLANTSFSTSGGYMLAGAVESPDNTEVFLYASGQPFTHGGDAANKTWGNNTGIFILRSRKHGWVSLDAPYDFSYRSRAEMPQFVTNQLLVPHRESHASDVFLLFNVKTSNVGFLIAELRGPDGIALAGFSLDDAVPIRGNSLRAAASWAGGNISSLSSLEGSLVSVLVAMVDTELFSLELGPA